MVSQQLRKGAAGILVSAVLTLFSSQLFAAKILAVDEGNRLSSGGWTTLFSGTFGDDLTVVNSWGTALGEDLSTYDIVWDGGFFSDPGAAAAAAVVAFVEGGGGFYGQTERPCCEPHNGWVEGIFKTLTGDNAMQFGGAGDGNGGTGVFLTPDTSILIGPNDIRNTNFNISAPGQLVVSDTSKIFAKQTGPGGFNIGVAYADDDLVNNSGRIVTISDIDWLSGINADEQLALENIREFLLDGVSLPPGCGAVPLPPGCPNPVPGPSTPALLMIGLGLLTYKRFMRKAA